MCDAGDDVAVLHHTAAGGTTSRTASWPFGPAGAEELTRPPASESVALPDGLDRDP